MTCSYILRKLDFSAIWRITCWDYVYYVPGSREDVDVLWIQQCYSLRYTIFTFKYIYYTRKLNFHHDLFMMMSTAWAQVRDRNIKFSVSFCQVIFSSCVFMWNIVILFRTHLIFELKCDVNSLIYSLWHFYVWLWVFSFFFHLIIVFFYWFMTVWTATLP